MDWNEVNGQRADATPQQRRAIYRFIAGTEADSVKELVRLMTTEEAAAVLSALTAADNRLKAKLVVVKRPVDPLLLIEQEEEKSKMEEGII
jgi:hypothetical protein